MPFNINLNSVDSRSVYRAPKKLCSNTASEIRDIPTTDSCIILDKSWKKVLWDKFAQLYIVNPLSKQLQRALLHSADIDPPTEETTHSLLLFSKHYKLLSEQTSHMPKKGENTNNTSVEIRLRMKTLCRCKIRADLPRVGPFMIRWLHTF